MLRGICALGSNPLDDGVFGGKEYDDEEGVRVRTHGMHLYNFFSAFITIAIIISMIIIMLILLASFSTPF